MRTSGATHPIAHLSLRASTPNLLILREKSFKIADLISCPCPTPSSSYVSNPSCHTSYLPFCPTPSNLPPAMCHLLFWQVLSLSKLHSGSSELLSARPDFGTSAFISNFSKNHAKSVNWKSSPLWPLSITDDIPGPLLPCREYLITLLSSAFTPGVPS